MNFQAKKIIYYLFLAILIVPLLFAQKPNYKFKSIDQPEGLINSTVQVIFEDSFGFIWLGTHQGVQRYDGINFKNYEYSERDSTGLSSNFICGFCEDADKNIWIVTSEGLNKYVRSTDKVIRYNWNNDQLNKSKNQLLSNVFQDQSDQNILWITSPENGLIKFNTANDSIVIYSMGDISYLPSSHSLTLPFPGEKNKLLLGTSNLLSFDKITGRFEVLLSLDENSEVPNNLINSAVIDPANNDIIWIATGDFWGRGSLGGLIRYNLTTGAKKLFSPETRPNEILSNHILSLCFSDNDKLWIGMRNDGTLIYDRKEDKFYNLKKNEFDKESFCTSDAVRSILKDRAGNIWFGTWGEGISLLSTSLQKFSSYKYLPNESKGLLDNYINTFTEDKDGNIWIGTKAGGISKFNPRTKVFENYFNEFVSSNGKSTEVTYLYYDRNENLWIGTYDDALYRYNPVTKSKIHYQKGELNKEVTQKRITAITEFKLGEIFISTYGGGLNIYDYKTDIFRHYVHDSKDSTSILDNQIWLPFSDGKGNFYFSGNSIGSLFKFNSITEKFSIDNPEDRRSNFVMPYSSSRGTIYVNEVNSGLTELNLGEKIKAKTLFDNSGNNIKNVESIIGDSRNNLWLGTGDGLLEYDPELKILNRYDNDDGLQGYVFNRFAALKTTNGEMYFGGTNGFSVFRPDEIKLSSYEPPIVFVDLKLFQESVQIGEASVLHKNILLTDQVELDYNENDFSISFAALDFSNPKRIQYKYILENHDKVWIYAGHKNYASYTNMDPGEYTLKVLATNSDGVWVKEPKQLSIIIHPPIWRTAGAYILYGLLFIAGIFTIDRIQRKRLIAKERTATQIREAELRAQIAEKESERKSYELEEARKLQLSMLPKAIPQLPNLDIAVYMKTATEVGGDYYDFHVHMDGTLTVVLGDATGHGMMSGMMVSIMKSLFMSDRTNKALKPFFENASASIKDMQLGRLMMALTCVQISNNKIKTTNAGMPPLFIYRNSLQTIEEIAINNMPLGAMKAVTYDVREVNIEKGDTLLLMSDGFAELKNENEDIYGYKRARNSFEEAAKKEPEEIITHLRAEARSWTSDKEPDDDVTFVVIKVK